MKRMAGWRWLGGSAFAALLVVSAVSPASAQSGRNRDRGPLGDLYSYIRVASPKAELAARMTRMNDRVRTAERNRELTRSEASDLYKRLDRVRDFLRDDRDLSRDEFRRRDSDLDGIERDFDRKLDRRDGRNGNRRDRRSDEDRDYYRSRDRDR